MVALLTARLVELDGRIWLEVFQVGRKICRRKAVKKVSVALSESKWSLALSRREYKYCGHPLRFRNFSAPARLARPFHARNGALSPCPRITSHLAASIIKAYITRVCHFCRDFLCPSAGHCCERDVYSSLSLPDWE